mgnify:CR=1 FL=1
MSETLNSDDNACHTRNDILGGLAPMSQALNPDYTACCTRRDLWEKLGPMSQTPNPDGHASHTWHYRWGIVQNVMEVGLIKNL